MARTSHSEVRHGAGRVRDITTRGDRLGNTNSLGRGVKSKSVGHRENIFCESKPYGPADRHVCQNFGAGAGAVVLEAEDCPSLENVFLTLPSKQQLDM